MAHGVFPIWSIMPCSEGGLSYSYLNHQSLSAISSVFTVVQIRLGRWRHLIHIPITSAVIRGKVKEFMPLTLPNRIQILGCTLPWKPCTWTFAQCFLFNGQSLPRPLKILYSPQSAKCLCFSLACFLQLIKQSAEQPGIAEVRCLPLMCLI